MKKPGKKTVIFLAVSAIAAAALIAGIVLTDGMGGDKESINTVMKDAVLHEGDGISLFGGNGVNPGLISSGVMTVSILIFALVLRLFVIPRFRIIPGKFQSVIEKAVEYFDGLGKNSNERHSGFIGAYAFCAGTYIFFGTLFELIGVPVQTVNGTTVCLPAPLSDINGAISIGCLSYLVILFGGLIIRGPKGMLLALKDFSLPISMSFRLFGALLSGALVTELIYYYAALSFVLPVIVGVLFTLLHAVIQAYVLTMLTTMFFGEVTEKPETIKERTAVGPVDRIAA